MISAACFFSVVLCNVILFTLCWVFAFAPSPSPLPPSTFPLVPLVWRDGCACCFPPVFVYPRHWAPQAFPGPFTGAQPSAKRPFAVWSRYRVPEPLAGGVFISLSSRSHSPVLSFPPKRDLSVQVLPLFFPIYILIIPEGFLTRSFFLHQARLGWARRAGRRSTSRGPCGGSR